MDMTLSEVQVSIQIFDWYGSIFTETRVNTWSVQVIGQFARWKPGDYNSYAPLINADTCKKIVRTLVYSTL